MHSQPILITGLGGTLGQAFTRICRGRNLPYEGLTRRELDICDPDALARVCAATRPWAIVNTAGYVRVDDAEQDTRVCYRANTDGPALLARVCAEQDIRLLTFSSDLVFNGKKRVPYTESDAVAPLNVYGQSKALAEACVRQANPDALIVRTSSFFGPWDGANFVTQSVERLAKGEKVVAASDLTVSPTYVPDLVQACLDLLLEGESGVWHLVNDGATTWADLARRAAVLADCDPNRVEGRPVAELGLPACRPHYSVLSTERGVRLPKLSDALNRYFAEVGTARQAAYDGELERVG
ncbi:MAG TPA: NAD(P)-dependent oxidoreductase [Chloroflexia bacterium]|nr:NAD(P)-dependent oxidoreductase [Chloroflexia bacterium]